MTTTEPVVLAVDGGNSKTDVALVDGHGRLLAATRGPTVSHQQVGLVSGADRLADLVATARAAAARPVAATSVTVAVLAMAGADTPGDARRLRHAAARRALAGEVEVINDAFAPIRAGSSTGWGIALICGSGVNAAAIGPDGRRARLAALGPIAGDWGGGGDIGLAALGAAVRARDRRGPRTTLERYVPAAFGMSRPIDVTYALERGRLSHSRLRELSPVVFRAAAEGDRMARSILDRLADELVAMATAMVHRLALSRRAPEIVLAGGVFAADDAAFQARLEEGIVRVAPGATLRRPSAPPVLGAALLGLDRLPLGSRARHDAETRVRQALERWRPPT